MNGILNPEILNNADHIGSASTVTDITGKFTEHCEYFPYGEVWISESANTTVLANLLFKFTSKELDTETGLYYYGARYMDPRLSRWISTDPILAQYLPTGNKDKDKNLPGMGGVFNTVNIDLYHYASNNPVRYIDPDGSQSAGWDVMFSQPEFEEIQQKCDNINHDSARFIENHNMLYATFDGILGIVDGFVGFNIFTNADGVPRAQGLYVNDATKAMLAKNAKIGKDFGSKIGWLNLEAGGAKLALKTGPKIGKAKDAVLGFLKGLIPDTEFPKKMSSGTEALGNVVANYVKETIADIGKKNDKK